jgi:poly-gamma-glutamate capsule biosynthesis protein CapA/YwtB (metallophosphatase superfamily)
MPDEATPDLLRLLLCGDVMPGRGVDQILPFPGDPALFEDYATSALDYVRLAERANGPIGRPADFDYVWGDARGERRHADLFVANLETAVTRRGAPEPKGINYRMTPDNVACLAAAGIDCCVLANNHALDWGRAGLADTLETLAAAGLATAGAGRDADEAAAPAVLPLPGGERVLVYGLAHPSSGVPPGWAAGPGRPGLWLLPDLSARTLAETVSRIRTSRRSGDVVVASIHWGANWGYSVGADERAFAEALIDEAGVDVVHGHSSHHPKAVAVHRGKPILFGCGDFLNDYEGIGGHAEYRPELVLLYRVSLGGPRRRLSALEMIPFRIRGFRLSRAAAPDAAWLARTMDRECRRFGGKVELSERSRLRLVWQ